MTIKFIATACMNQLCDFLTGKQVDTPRKALNIIDIVLKELTAQRFDFSCFGTFVVLISLKWSKFVLSNVPLMIYAVQSG